MNDETKEISTSWHSYPSPKALGHGMIKDLLLDPVIVEEKLDGSQFSFGMFPNETGELELKFRSKGSQINTFAPEKMFLNGIEAIKEIQSLLTPGWTYRCEYFQKPKHNVLAYDRIPVRHVIIIDINNAHEQYLNYADKLAEAQRLGLEITPILYEGTIDNPFMVRDFLEKTSILGGPKIEGVVIKNYKRFTMDGKVQMGKFVSEEFKEVHTGEWKKENPDNGDIVSILISKYRSPARWQKALQHLKEAGKIKGEMSDMQFLFPEVTEDTKKECAEEIKELLFNWAWKNIARSLTGGLPEWYKEQLLKQQFERDGETVSCEPHKLEVEGSTPSPANPEVS